MKLSRLFFAFLPVCFVALSLQAQVKDSVPSVKVSGEVTQALKLTVADIAKMPHINTSLKDRDGKTVSYSGVSVPDILTRAGVTINKQLRGENLAKYMLVKCADGYEVLFSLAEFDSSFTDKTITLADALEGKPLPAGKGPFRLVVPGEKKPARSCFQVTEFVIKFAKD
jgi:DMSO/TMAO reductase YedYZ molybdopterin-dependent catalytic subunit